MGSKQGLLAGVVSFKGLGGRVGLKVARATGIDVEPQELAQVGLSQRV